MIYLGAPVVLAFLLPLHIPSQPATSRNLEYVMPLEEPAVRFKGSEARRSGGKALELGLSPSGQLLCTAVGTWANFAAFLCLKFPICEMGLKII